MCWRSPGACADEGSAWCSLFFQCSSRSRERHQLAVLVFSRSSHDSWQPLYQTRYHHLPSAFLPQLSCFTQSPLAASESFLRHCASGRATAAFSRADHLATTREDVATQYIVGIVVSSRNGVLLVTLLLVLLTIPPLPVPGFLQALSTARFQHNDNRCSSSRTEDR